MTALEVYGGPLGMDASRPESHRFVYIVKDEVKTQEAIEFLKRNGYMEYNVTEHNGSKVYVFRYDNEHWPRLFGEILNG